MYRFFAVLLFVLPGFAHAADLLKQSEVEGFTKVMEQMEDLSEKYPDAEADFDMDVDFQQMMTMMDTMFADGKINAFGVMTDTMMKHPEMSREMLKLVRQNGFSSVPDFTDVGNRVVAAMMRADVSASDLREMKMMSSLPESQMAMIPEPMRKMAMYGPVIAEALESVPSEDVQLVKKLKPFDR